MAYFKKFVVALKKMGIKVNPGVVLMIVLAVTLAVVLYRWWAAKKKNAEDAGSGGDGATSQSQAPAGPPPVPKGRFLQIWRRFLAELPPMVRRSIHQFQPMVVLGGIGTGKSALISRYTDWRRQARYLFASELDDPDLQIYLGSRVLVLELPPSALAGSERGLREALLTLFRSLFRRRTPVVVVALNPLELQQMTPDETRALADAIRGKINLLSFVRRKPIEVRLAVTHMDRVPGFAELAEVVRRRSGSLELPMPGGVAGTELEAALAERLGGLAQVRSAALLALSADRYLAVISFLRQAPSLLAPVGSFASALLTPEPLSRQPVLSAIHLTSAQLHEPVSAPFRAPEVTEDRLRNPLERHRVAAIAIGVVLSIGLGWAYVRERSLWTTARGALQRYVAESGLRQRPELEQALRSQVMDFIHRRTFPSFFGTAEAKASQAVAERLRRDFVLHNLRDARAHPRGARRAVYLAALADLRPSSDLVLLLEGEDVRKRWGATAGLRTSMIEDYVDVVGALGPDASAPLDLASDVWLDADRHPAADVQTLYAFARSVRQAIERGEIDERALAGIRHQAGQLRAVVGDVASSPDVSEILRIRAADDPDQADVAARLVPHLIELQAPELLGTADRRTELQSFLGLVESTRISRPPSVPRHYLDVCEWVSLTLGAAQLRVAGSKPQRDPAKIEIAIDGRLFRGSEWLGLTRDHTVIQVVRSYLARPDRDKAVFFLPGVEHPSLVMNPDTRGSFLFSGRARIPGRYTRSALMSDVAPALSCHSRTLPALARIDANTAKDLDAVIRREVEQYSEVYERALQDFYSAFNIRTDGAVDNLRVVLDRLLSGASPLTRHLSLVGSNARLAKLEPSVRTQLGALIDRLEPLRALDKAVTSTVSGEPAYQSYLLLLRQTQEALQPPDPGLAPPAEAVPSSMQTLRDRSTVCVISIDRQNSVTQSTRRTKLPVESTLDALQAEPNSTSPVVGDRESSHKNVIRRSDYDFPSATLLTLGSGDRTQ